MCVGEGKRERERDAERSESVFGRVAVTEWQIVRAVQQHLLDVGQRSRERGKEKTARRVVFTVESAFRSISHRSVRRPLAPSLYPSSVLSIFGAASILAGDLDGIGIFDHGHSD